MAAHGIERFARAELNDEIEFLLARAQAVGISHANKRFGNFGLKARSYAVLSLAASDLHPTQRELADFLSLDASQIVALVDHLEQQELVERREREREAQRRLQEEYLAELAAKRRRRILVAVLVLAVVVTLAIVLVSAFSGGDGAGAVSAVAVSSRAVIAGHVR